MKLGSLEVAVQVIIMVDMGLVGCWEAASG